MQTDRPTSVRVGPHVYQILYDDESWLQFVSKKKKKTLAGLTLHEKNVLLINEEKLSVSEQKDTVVHEIFHAILAQHAFVHLPIELPTDKHDLEELFILLVTPVWLEVLQNNPELVMWLVDG